MKKLLVFIVMTLIFKAICFGYIKKDYSLLSKYNNKYEFVDFNKYLKTVETKREKYYRITEFVDSYLSYDQIHTKFTFNDFKEMMCYNYEESVRLRKGLCEDYVNVFHNICNQNNLKSDVMSGYTKQLNNSKQTVIAPHAWIIADSMIIDPTFCDSYVSKSNVCDSIYFDIDPTIAAYTYFPCTNESMISLEKKYNASSKDISTNVLLKDKFICELDTTKPILTKIYVDFEWFLTTPYISHKYCLSEKVTVKTIAYINDTVTKFYFFRHITQHKIIKDSIVYKKYELENLQPYKTVEKLDVYCEYGTNSIREQIYTRHRKDYVFNK